MAQRERWLLWAPLGAIFGAAAHLAREVAPPAYLAPAAFLICMVAAVALGLWPSRTRGGAANLLRVCGAGLFTLIAAVALGACAAEVRVISAAAPRLAEELGPVMIEGWVEEVEAGAPRTRVTLRVRTLEGMAPAPRFARLTMPGARAFSAGRAIRCRAMLRPPDGPLAPGAYDFARRAYFEQLGAAGFTLGRCRPIAAAFPAGIAGARLRLAAVRSDLADAIYAASPGAGGAVAASLLVGDRSFLSEEVNTALRDSGLGHVLSVSGLHMGVVGGLVFAALTGFFALIAPLALRVPVRKLAALGALGVLTLYLVISGASVPALRAYVMAVVAFGAILIDRPAISMRGLALAALIITLLLPESVLEPGFQMSFAATAALVAAFETTTRRDEPHLPAPGPIVGTLQWMVRGLTGAILISFVAGLATDPFALYHFQRFSAYGLPANLTAAPLVSFVIAPLAVAAALAAPFGLAEAPLQALAAACDLLVGIGAAFAARPEAVAALPRPPDGAFLLAVFALSWICLWRGAARWLGAPLLAGAVILYAFAPRPVLLFDGELRAVLARDVGQGGAWVLMRPYGRSTFARDRIGAMAGLAPAALDRLAPPACAEALCFWAIGPHANAAIVMRPEGWADSRLAGAIVLSRLPAPPGFVSRMRPMDAGALAAQGGGALTLREGRFSITRARSPGATRPWRAGQPH